MSSNCVRVSWFSDSKRSDGIKLSLLNSYQIQSKAVLSWAPRWEAACRRVLLYVQNGETPPILFCIWQCFQCQLHCFTAITFPACLSCTNCQDSRLPVSFCLQLQVNTHQVERPLIVSDIYIKTRLEHPPRPAMLGMSSLGEYCRAFIWGATLH